MNFAKILSSQIDLIGYCKESRELAIRFSGGDVYLYQDVPSGVVLDITYARSPGSQFTKTVKAGPYKYAKLDSASEIANRMNQFAATLGAGVPR